MATTALSCFPVSAALSTRKSSQKKSLSPSAEILSNDMNLSMTWTQVAGPCHVDAPSAWKGCSLSDWQQDSITSFVETWRVGETSAERDESMGSQPLAPGSAPEVVRMGAKPSKSRKKTGKFQSSQASEQKTATAAADASAKIISQTEESFNPVGNALALSIPVPGMEENSAEIFQGILSPSKTKGSSNKVLEDIIKAAKDAGATFVQSEEGTGKDVAGSETDETAALKFDFVVIGSGIAGLRFALDVAEFGTVAVVTKAERQEGSTQYAQGGVSAVLDPTDSVENHIRDTIVAGAYLSDEEVVEVVCREGPDRVRELMAMGASFDKAEDGRLQLAREGGHSHNRIVHAADVTGREIERALLVAAQKSENINLFEHHFVVDLLTTQEADGGSVCYGVDALDVRTGKVIRFMAGATLLASGGAGHVYPNTTNPSVATGDGIALAQRAHAIISNMEFVQFHPTALADVGLPNPPAVPRSNAFLITEAVRGAGGFLYNQAGERFMLHYDERAELAPRDVVARSIDDQLKKRGEDFVWLDISHKPREEILSHFPNIAEECRRGGIDITKEPIPVVPAAHYMCGGVQTGLFGETSVKGLWAAGEVACTGLHGANRLASNSLLEALVFAQRAVEPAIEHALFQKQKGLKSEYVDMSRHEDEGSFVLENRDEQMRYILEALPRPEGIAEGDSRAMEASEVTKAYRSQLQEVMWNYVGIVRSTERLVCAESEVLRIAKAWKKDLKMRAGLPPDAVTVAVCEMRNLLSVAVLIVQSALRRQESRGLHFTTDFPESCDSERLPTVLFPGSILPLWASSRVAASEEVPMDLNPSGIAYSTGLVNRGQPAKSSLASSKRQVVGVRVKAFPDSTKPKSCNKRLA